MHLTEILSLRHAPAAGLYLHLTRRCPLSCGHCSTNSTLQSEEYEAGIFLRLVQSFTVEDRPDILVLTGGEPLVRARLVQDLTDAAHAVGTKVAIGTGMFWARQPAPTPAVDRALRSVDHVAASVTVFHEREVSRSAMMRGLRRLVDQGTDASVHIVGVDEHDPYLAEATDDIRRTLDDRVPILVGLVRPVGRAAEWLPQDDLPVSSPADSLPCAVAAWPVVSYDGTVVGCSNQSVVDGPRPPHLAIGHAATDSWATLRERHCNSPLLRAIRLFGPTYVATRYSEGAVACDGFCSTCVRLSDSPGIAQRVEPDVSGPAMAACEHLVAMFQEECFVGRHSPPGFAGLSSLGYSGDASSPLRAPQPLGAPP